jgi:flagellar hook-associated protein 3 FlgL
LADQRRLEKNMRISTGMIFDLAVSNINKQTASLLHSSQQVSSGRRILTPSDDPVAAARALEVQQAQDITTQYTTNQSNAKSALGLSDASLSSINDLLTRVRELAVQGGNATLSSSDRQSIGHELTANFDQLLGLANTTDGAGQYLFSGYMGNAQPFAGTVANGVSYAGDSGQRLLQVSASRQLEVSDAGNDIFQRIANGNGFFATGYNANNVGTGVIGAGSVTDPAKWASTSNSGDLTVKFWVDTTGAIGAVNGTYYDLVDASTGHSLFTNAASASGAGGSYTHAYAAGQAISLSGLNAAFPPGDFGASVIITGTPASGDIFTISNKTPTQDIFKTLANLINVLTSSQDSTPAGQAALTSDIGFALTNLDQASNNILRVRSLIGSRLNEVDALDNTNSALSLQYQQTLSNLQDLDYAKAISDLTRNQTGLTAAQKTFQMTTQLSLFNYLP